MAINNELDTDAAAARNDSIQARCLVGHIFSARKEDIRSSASGKSFVTTCPKCGRVARLNREKVLPLFGYAPRDKKSMAMLLTTLAQPSQNSQSDQQDVDSGQDDESELDIYDEDLLDSLTGDEDEDDEDDDDEYTDDEDDDDEKERVAVYEDVDDVTGEKKSVSRPRVLDAQQADDMRSRLRGATIRKTPRQSKKPKRVERKKPREPENYRGARREHIVEDESENSDERYPNSARSVKRVRPQLFSNKPMDRNEILKKVVAEEIGDDNDAYDRIAAMIDLQPEGVNPIYAQATLELHFSKQQVATLIRRWEAEIAIQGQRQMREQDALNILMQTSAMPANYNQGDPRMGYGYNRFVTPPSPPEGFPIQMWRSMTPEQQMDYYQQQPAYPQPRAGFVPPQQQVPYQQGYPQQPAGRNLTAFEIREIIESAVEDRMRGLRGAVAQREDSSRADEVRELRTLLFDILREKNTAQTPPAGQNNPQVDMLLSNQGKMLDTLLRNALDSSKSDPTREIILREIQELKKNQDQPLNNPAPSHEELRQRIELQKLSNEFELAQQEFMDKREGRQFTRDIAEQALKRIGETITTAYIESARIKSAIPTSSGAMAMSANTQPSGGLTPTPSQHSRQPHPTSSVGKASPDELTKYLDDALESKPTPIQHPETPRENDQSQNVPAKKTQRGTEFECPECGTNLTIATGEKSVTCQRCASVYDVAPTKPSANVTPPSVGADASESGVANVGPETTKAPRSRKSRTKSEQDEQPINSSAPSFLI